MIQKMKHLAGPVIAILMLGVSNCIMLNFGNGSNMAHSNDWTDYSNCLNAPAWADGVVQGEYLLNNNAIDSSCINIGSKDGFAANIQWISDRNNNAGRSAQFNGIDSYIDLMPFNHYIWVGNMSYSVNLWVKIPVANTGNQTIISTYDSTSLDNEYWLDITVDGAGKIVSNTLYSGNNYVLTGTNALNDNSWHNITFVMDVNLSRQLLYIDGVLDKTTTTIANIGTPGNDGPGRVRLGAKFRNNANTEFFDGSIDDVRLFQYALNQNNINDIFVFY